MTCPSEAEHCGASGRKYGVDSNLLLLACLVLICQAWNLGS